MKFKNIVTTSIGTIILLLSTFLYFADLVLPTKLDIGWKELAFPAAIGLWLLFAKDDDYMYPGKVIMGILGKKETPEQNNTTPK